MKRLDISGKKFGELIAIKDAGKDKKGNRLWECHCDCGNTTVVATNLLTGGNTKSCGCLRAGNNILPEGEASFNALYAAYKNNAEKKDRKFDLTKDQFRKITNQECIYCGSPPTQEKRHHKNANGTYIYNGIDRVDNSKGYIKGNCVPCCKYCNRMKRDQTEEEFFNQIVKVYEKRCK